MSCKRSPRLIGVDGNQGVIKIKKGQTGLVQGVHSSKKEERRV